MSPKKLANKLTIAIALFYKQYQICVDVLFYRLLSQLLNFILLCLTNCIGGVIISMFSNFVFATTQH
jgi:hypothetical protein